MKKSWRGIKLTTKIADVNMKKRRLDGFHWFKECVETMRDNPDICLKKYNCIIGKLIKLIKEIEK